VALKGTMAARPDDGATSQGTTATPLLKRSGLLQGSDDVNVGAGSTKAVVAWSTDGRLRSGPDGPRYGLRSFFFKLIFGVG
jgi:hypothetical protein